MSIHGRSLSSLSLLHALLLNILVLSTSNAITTLNFSCSEAERSALLAIKSDLNNTNLWLSSWTGLHCCNWTHVTCDTSNHASILNLRYPYTRDTLAPSKVNPSLSLLTHLTSLDLSLNNFAGAPIPDSIASLHNLRYLNLSYSFFNGTIPDLGKLTDLRSLDLHIVPGGVYSLMSHDLHWLSNTPHLNYLDLSAVDLNYPNWAHDINMLPSLSVLNLKSCSLGEIPAIFPSVNFSALTVLDLSSNYLNSSIPGWLFNITSLVDVRLSASGLHGEIPYALGGLANLRHLDLSMNYLDGGVPNSLGNLSQLEYLDLTSNQIEGEIPRSTGKLSRLRFLDLSINQISGAIPDSMGDIKMLEHLSLSSNMISGGVPESIGNLSKLSSLSFTLNDISGSIPQTIGKLGQLQLLDISFNAIAGRIPESIGNLSLLQEMDLSRNSLSREIPETVGKLYNLNHLELQRNNLSGSLPSTMGNLCKLVHLEMSQNTIGGSITALLEGFNRCIKQDQGGLIRLLLGRNRFNGTVPEVLGELSSLVSLDLSSNSFVGALTEAHFAKLGNLSGIDLSFNSLEMRVGEEWVPPFSATGIRLCACRMGLSFPAWLQTQKTLSDICLSESGIAGGIPDWLWDSIYFYQSSLNLSHNNLTGQLPTSVGGFMFDIFDVSYNNLEGPVPQLNTYVLNYVHLSNNNFSGTIPQSIASGVTNLQEFSSSHNQISGSIPSFFCNLTGLRVLDLSSNDLSGGIPYCWDTSSSLSIIDLSSNNLSREIPEEITKLSGLLFLNLSNNHLSGHMPQSMNALAQLESLDLSMNNLLGKIPPSLADLSFLNQLNLSYNNLSGRIPPGKLQSFDFSVFEGNPYLCGPPLPVNCTDGNLTPESHIVVQEKEMETRTCIGFASGCNNAEGRKKKVILPVNP